MLLAWSCLSAFALEPHGESFLLTPHDKLYDVFFLNELKGWTIGSRGLILHTEDGGKSWRHQKSGTEESLFSFAFLNHKGWICGSGGVMFHTGNAGKEWTLQPSGTNAALFGVQFASEEKGFVVGSFGTALRSENGGLKWESLNLNWEVYLKELIEKKGQLEPHLYDVFFASQDLGWIVGEFGLILHSSDGGRTWKRQTVPTAKALFRVLFIDANRGWIVGQNGLVLITGDRGKHWKSLETGSRESLFNISVQDRRGLIVGERGTILSSDDEGMTWKAKESNSFRITSWLRGVSSAGKKRFVVVGDRGVVRAME